MHFEDMQSTSMGESTSSLEFFSWSEQSLGDVAISIVMYTEKGFQWLMVSTRSCHIRILHHCGLAWRYGTIHCKDKQEGRPGLV